MKKLLSLLIALSMLAPFAALGESDAPARYTLGDPIRDFTVTSIDGRTFTLSELLREKDMVLLNLWATWCGPCEMEFPAMQAAYEEYGDRIEILALSIDDADTDEKLTEYVASHGMTFPVGHDTYDLMSAFGQSGIPTSVVIDRFGTVCYVESGAMTDPSMFAALFAPFIGEDYTESALFDELPQLRPPFAREDEQTLADALGVPAVRNPEDEYVWPMLTAEADGRTVVSASNAGNTAETKSELTACVSANAGDAISVVFSLDSSPVFDICCILVNGVRVKGFTGEYGWTAWAYPVPENGDYEITLQYQRYSGDDFGDHLYVDAIEVLTGEDAAAALQSASAWPRSAESSIVPASPEARRLDVSDPQLLHDTVGCTSVWIIPEEEPTFTAEIGGELDPDIAFFYSYYDVYMTLMKHTLTEDGLYAYTTFMDSLALTGYSYGAVLLYPDVASYPSEGILFFMDEENAEYFFTTVYLNETGSPMMSWSYAEP